VKDRDIDRHFPVRISVVIGGGIDPREWSVKYSLMVDWLGETVGNYRHAARSVRSLGGPDTLHVYFASFDDARVFLDRFELPIVQIGDHPKR
jgi:hypothetical protein